jgi:hypothetical protein
MAGVCMHNAALNVTQCDLDHITKQGFKIRQIESSACVSVPPFI